MTVEDDDDVVHVFRVCTADYNLYEKDGQWWLTFYCRTGGRISPVDRADPEPWLEINVPLGKPMAELDAGDTISGSAYDDAFGGNLTNFYYFAHGGFENPIIKIQAVDTEGVTAEITGEGGYLPVVVRARFIRNADRRRSFA